MFTILKLTKFECSKSGNTSYRKNSVIIVLEIEVIHSGAEVGYKVGNPVPMDAEGSGFPGADNVAIVQLAHEQDMLVVKYSHEDLMFSPQVDIIEKNPPAHALSPYFIAKEDTEEDVTVGGPVVRNMVIMKLIRKGLTDKLEAKGTDKERKSVMNILELIWNEVANAIHDEIDGLAIFYLKFTRLTKGMAYGLIIFHRGSTLLVETMGKTKARHTWENPVEETDMLKIKNLTQVKDFVQVALKKLESILGRELHNSSHQIFPHYFTFLFPQDRDVFSHYGDENHSEFCWLCGVTVRKLKKATCAGCLVARYCTLGCQKEDWSRHRNYCMKKKASREEEAMTVPKVSERVFIDWEQEVD